jgi:DNA polymerase III epsilon subunit family exonuclease
MEAKFFNDYVVVDIETTGLEASYCDIIEIGMLRVQNGEIIDRFDRLIKPHGSIPCDITRLTNITNQMVLNEPDIEEILKEFYSKITPADIVVGHNVEFDKGFIQDKSERFLKKPFENVCVDTLALAKELVPNLDSYSLSSLTSFFEITNDNAHRALSDCEATYKLYEKLKNLSFRKGE